jgi:hypothetical protein
VVPAAVLESAAYPLTLDPTVSSPTPVSGPGTRAVPSVAFNGSDTFLVVWQDRRGTTGQDIFGARLRADGTVIDTSGIPIDTAAHDQLGPDVAWNGNTFLVVYQHQFGGTDPDIRARLVSAAGVVSSAIVVSSLGVREEAPAVAAGGSNFLVVWQDDRRDSFNYEIWGTRVSGTGSVLDPGTSNIAVSRTTNQQPFDVGPDVAWNGSVFQVVWERVVLGEPPVPSDIMRQGVSAAGGTLGQAQYSFGRGRESEPAVASDGTNFLATWRDSQNPTNEFDIVGALTDGAGNGLVSDIPISTLGRSQDTPAVAYDGAYLVLWRDRRRAGQTDVFAVRVERDGSVQDFSGFVIAGATGTDEDFPAVSGGPGSTWRTVYESGAGASTSIVSRRVSPK